MVVEVVVGAVMRESWAVVDRRVQQKKGLPVVRRRVLRSNRWDWMMVGVGSRVPVRYSRVWRSLGGVGFNYWSKNMATCVGNQTNEWSGECGIQWNDGVWEGEGYTKATKLCESQTSGGVGNLYREQKEKVRKERKKNLIRLETEEKQEKKRSSGRVKE